MKPHNASGPGKERGAGVKALKFAGVLLAELALIAGVAIFFLLSISAYIVRGIGQLTVWAFTNVHQEMERMSQLSNEQAGKIGKIRSRLWNELHFAVKYRRALRLCEKVAEQLRLEP